MNERLSRRGRLASVLLVSAIACNVPRAFGQDRRQADVAAPTMEERVVGPYDVHVLAGGPAFSRPVPAASEVLTATGVYTLSLWVEVSAATPRTTLLAGLGDLAQENSRYLGLQEGKPFLRYGAGSLLTCATALPNGWHQLVVVSDGATESLVVDGREVARGALVSGPVTSRLVMAPTFVLADFAYEHFGGDLVHVTLTPEAMTSQQLTAALLRGPMPWPCTGTMLRCPGRCRRARRPGTRSRRTLR